MKNVLLLCLLCLVSGSFQKQKVKESDLLKENLKGNVVCIINPSCSKCNKNGEKTG